MAASRRDLNLGADMFPDDLVIEFLIRLPRKQVAQCKCVCKSWRLVIRSTQFKDVYGIRLRGLIHHWFEPVTKNAWDRLQVSFFSHFRGIKEPEQEQEDFSFMFKFRIHVQHLGMTQIVNGLLCVVHGTAESGTHLTLYNVCTGESIMVPEPVRDGNDQRARFYLGYDPESGLYKLLRIMRSRNLVTAHILTLSPSSSPSTWRELNHNLEILGYNEMTTSPSSGEIVLVNTARNDAFCFSRDHTSKVVTRFQVGKLPDRPFVFA